MIGIVKDKDARWFDELYKRHYNKAYNYVKKIVKDAAIAEDIVQDGFLTVWDKIETFSRSEEEIIGWILTIMKYKAMGILKREGKRNEKERNSILYINKNDSSLLKEINTIDIATKLTKLERNYREVLHKKYFEGYTLEEIGNEMQVSTTTAGAWYKAALEQLKEVIQGASYVEAVQELSFKDIPGEYAADLTWPRKCLFFLKSYGYLKEEDIIQNVKWLEPEVNMKTAARGVKNGLQTLRTAGKIHNFGLQKLTLI